jgi:hypothetical protein
MKNAVPSGILAALVLCVSCGRPVIKQQVIVPKGHDIVKAQKGDTVEYEVSFQDAADRKKFTQTFEKLLGEYPFKRDTLAQNRRFRLALASAPAARITPEPAPVETPVAMEAPAASADSEKIMPASGGSVTFYSQRAALCGPFERLVGCNPFDGNACPGPADAAAAGYFQVKNSSDREITIALTDKAMNASGRRQTSLDVINAWTALVKSHPAEGLALFRNVKGIGGFVRGRETVIAGFTATDDRTVAIRFDPPDPRGLARLCTPRLMPASLGMGPYTVKSERAGSLVLAPNPHFPGAKAYLSSCAVRLGGDANAVLSFSLGRYDAVELHSEKDLDFARHKAPPQSSLAVFSQDRYFLACALDNAAIRRAVKSALNPREILANFIKTEGSVLAAVESDNPPVPPPTDAGGTGAQQQIAVLYRSDDPVSATVAEKIVADLTRAGLSAALRAATQKDYEASLVRRDFGVAVGWAPSGVTFDESEKLRLETMWFPEAAEEGARIADAREIPLFSVKEYLLCQKKVSFAGDVIEGVFFSE